MPLSESDDEQEVDEGVANLKEKLIWKSELDEKHQENGIIFNLF